MVVLVLVFVWWLLWIVKIVDEVCVIWLFYFELVDGGVLFVYEVG